MHGNADRRQRVSGSVVMIEAARKSLACVTRKIELELVAGARRRIRPDGATAVVEAGLGVRYRYDARGAAEELRKFGESDRLLIIEATGRMTLPQELRDRGDCLRICGRELAQIDFFPGQRCRTAGSGEMAPR